MEMREGKEEGKRGEEGDRELGIGSERGGRKKEGKEEDKRR